MIETFILDGSVTLVALAILIVELALVVGIAIRNGRRPDASLIANGLSGLFLILALRAALIGQGSGPIALFLGLGGLAHLADLVLRRRRRTN